MLYESVCMFGSVVFKQQRVCVYRRHQRQTGISQFRECESRHLRPFSDSRRSLTLSHHDAVRVGLNLSLFFNHQALCALGSFCLSQCFH